MVNEGRYRAKIKDYGIGQSKSGDPTPMILFTFKDAEGKQQELTWRGTLKEGRGREITIDALLTCGFKGDDIASLAPGIESNVLDAQTEVDITVGHEEFEGKTRAKIQWINPAGGAAFAKRMNQAEAVTKMAGLNLKADFAARRKETGIKDKSQEIPF